MLLSTVLKAIRANRVKSALIYLSLVVTISAIFLISAISHGVISMYSNILQSSGDIIVTQKNISDTFFSDVSRDLIPKIAKIEGVRRVSAIIVGASPVESLPIVALYGVSKNLYLRYKLQSGEYPSKGKVIIGASIYKSLADKKTIHIANKSFGLAGVFHSDIGFENGGVVMSLQDASDIFHKSASMLYVTIDIAHDAKAIMQKIAKLDNNIAVKSTKDFVKHYNQFKIISTSSLLVSLIAFVMGLIAIGSIMSITVLQRRDEFGIMKALGVSSVKIASLIILEGVVTAIFAFVSASILSAIALETIKHIDKFQGYVSGSIDLHLASLVFVATMVMTILGALIPVYTALKVDPITLMQRGN